MFPWVLGSFFWPAVLFCSLFFLPPFIQLLHHLKIVNFTNQFEEKVYFDSNGEPVPLYDIINWQKDSKGIIR